MANIKIENTFVSDMVLEAVPSTISPTLTPMAPTGSPDMNPVDWYISDMVSKNMGDISVPVYNKIQYVIIKPTKSWEFTVTDYKEIAYYNNLKLANAKITVS